MPGQVRCILFERERFGRPSPSLTEDGPEPLLRAHNRRIVDIDIRLSDWTQMVVRRGGESLRSVEIIGKPRRRVITSDRFHVLQTRWMDHSTVTKRCSTAERIGPVLPGMNLTLAIPAIECGS